MGVLRDVERVRLSQLLWCWRRPKTLVEAASDWDLSHRLAVIRRIHERAA